MREAAGKMKSARSACALLVIAAWFCLSNHCALGSALPPRELPPAESDGCPMHSTPKKVPATKTPCCKELRATVAKSVMANPTALRLIGWRDHAPEIFIPVVRFAIEIEGLDTGPPGCLSFAESVLQESMLSHAPPVP